MKYGLIGERLSHSFSAEVHAQLADYSYELCEIPEDSLDAFMRSGDFLGINVTIPYKKAVIPYLDELDESALQTGAVNTVVRREGRLIGYNTDIYGMRLLLRRAGISVKGKKVLILGTGGTSRTAEALVSSLGAASAYRVSRSEKEGAITYSEAYASHTDAEVIINTTPVGMYPNIFNTPIDLSPFSRLGGVLDAIYNPNSSALVSEARSRGITAVGGLYMLVAQAVRASEIFLDKEYDPDTVERVYKKIAAGRRNTVLIGMPGSGKSTVGRLLAESTGLPFTDTDTLLAERVGLSPERIIREHGEEYFRDRESEAIAEVAAQSGSVIATGGGAVLREKNAEWLKMNGTLVFIDRPLSLLAAGEGRPLTPDRAALEAKYRERYPIYTARADLTVDGSGTPSEVAGRIRERLSELDI